jgi:succinate dehydrogenase/fumarate reductase flavoprotein subunit
MTADPMDPPSQVPESVDVLVAGSGAAGLTAALAAAANGATVLVAEHAEKLGGTTALSGGRVWVPGNHLQAAGDGDDDGPHAGAAYLKGLFSDRYPEMTEAFLRDAPRMARFVEQHSPHRFVACPSYPDYFPSRPGATVGGRALDAEPLDTAGLSPLVQDVLVPPGYLPMTFAEWERLRYPGRYDWRLLDERRRTGIRTGGVALVAALLHGAEKAGVRVLAGVRLTGIELTELTENQPTRASASLEIQRSGQETRIAAHSVILATGGFDWDRELRGRFHPRAQRASGAPPSNTGDGLRIAERAGARLDNLSEGWWMPMMAIPGENLGGEQFYRSLIRERGLPRQIMVNAAGRRFVDEALPYNEIGKALHAQAGKVHLVFDAAYRDRYPLPGLDREGPVPDWIAHGASLAGLAARIGVDPDVLENTVSRWNEGCASGADPDFGRGENAYERFCGDPAIRPNGSIGPIDEAPYFAVEVLAGTIGTKGGPVTDTHGVVQGRGGDPILGLYAVGNTAAFWTSDGYPGPGATLAVGMTMGYRAGLHAAAGARSVR